MKIGIVGWGLEAQSAFKYFGPDNDYLIVSESKQDNLPLESEHVQVRFLPGTAPTGIGGQVKDLSYLAGIENCDKIVYQPTAYFNLKKAFGDDESFWAKATTVYDIFFEKCPSKNIIGVTGSKGKGTTSTLVAKMLEAEGRRVHLGGNIGTPILDLLPDIQPSDWVIWELANFQLKAASHSPHIAVCLMITEEHLDWHPSFEDYIESKANLFRHQTPEDIAIYYARNDYSKKIVGNSPGKKVPYFEKPGAYVREDGMIVIGDNEKEIINKSEVKLLGEHNLQNICAAATTVFEAVGALDKAKVVLSSFKGLEHRLELVRELGGVKYYDDSFGTTPDTTIVAMKAFVNPKVMIIGGHDKGLSLDSLIAEVLAQRVRHIIAIGDIGPKIAQMLTERNYKNVTFGLKTMDEIVNAARQQAKPGDVVLLSCGTSSFGLFKDYKDRGEQFKSAVQALV